MASELSEPFNTPPLRPAGHSGVESRNKRIAQNVALVMAAIGALGVVAGVNLGLLLQRFLPPMRDELLVAIIAGSGISITLGYLWLNRVLNRSEKQDHNDILGVRGERIVAEALDELKRDGYHVFHDVPPEREAKPGEKLANFDHIVIGPAGVFVIETKTRSLPAESNEIVVTSDGRVLVNNVEPERCPLRQASTLARAMQRMLERDAGVTKPPVRPVVVFPGKWFIKDRAYRDAGGNVWTLTETAFAKWVRSPKESVRLSESQVAQLSACISKHCRMQ